MFCIFSLLSPSYSIADGPSEPPIPLTRSIDQILQRSRSLDTLTGLAVVKFQSPKIKKKFKAAVMVSKKGWVRVDGLSPFGSPVFHLLYTPEGWLIYFPSSGLLHMDRPEAENSFRFLDFFGAGHDFLGLVSGCPLMPDTSGKATFLEVDEGKEFLLIVEQNPGAGMKTKLEPSLLPRETVISEGGGRTLTVDYSNYKQIEDFWFPLQSVFQIPGEKVLLELVFKNIRLEKELPAERYRIPVTPQSTYLGREDIDEQLNLSDP